MASSRIEVIAAARAGDVKALRELLSCESVTAAAAALLMIRDADGWTPMHHAAGEGMLCCVRLLCEKGADKDAQDNVRYPPVDF